MSGSHYKPQVTVTTQVLPYDQLSPRNFERLCLWLVNREGYEHAEHLGASGGEQGRDIQAARDDQRIIIQCKRVKSFGPSDAVKEVDKILGLPREKQPYELIFLVTCDVSVQARDAARKRSGKKFVCSFWASTELDERVKRYPDLLREFFGGTDREVIAEDRSYQVYGLPNPYLGLHSFTYEDRRAFAGRKTTIRQAVEKLTNPAHPMNLLFITGASGCGKSSFVQAGLLVALEEHYKKRYKQVRHAIFRPSTAPIAMLGDALTQLGIPSIKKETLNVLTGDDFNHHLGENTTEEQVNLLVVDQFEECFTQSSKEQKSLLFGIMEGLGEFSRIRTHVIVTLRSDYLDDLFAYSDLWRVREQGIELRGMSIDELKDAIQQPLFACADRDERYKGKRFEPALLERLATDAAQEPTYLPLLQVTLQEIWKGGNLVLERYDQLSDAIRQHAEFVYGFEDHDSTVPVKERSRADQDEILDIFTDLVEVSLDDDPHRDVRRRRMKNELVGDSIQRGKLLDNLVKARLLSTGLEVRMDQQVEIVDIIHESLIANWSRLRQAISDKRQNLQRRVLFEQALHEWQAHDQQGEYLLGGVRLAEGRELKWERDIVLRGEEAQQFLRSSEEKAEAAHRRTRNVFIAVLVVVTTLAVVASWFAYQTAQQSRAVLSTALAMQSQNIVEQAPDLGLLLAVEAFRNSPVELAQDALLKALDDFTEVPTVLRGHDDAVTTLAFSQDSQWLATGGKDWTTRVWDLNTIKQDAFLPTVLRGIDGPVEDLQFSPDGSWLASSNQFGTVNLWEQNSGDAGLGPYQLRQSLHNNLASIGGMAFSPDNHYLFTGVNKQTPLSLSGIRPVVNVVDLTETELGEKPITLPDPPNGPVTAIAVDPENQWLVTGCSYEVSRNADESGGNYLCKSRLWRIERLQEDPVLLRERGGSESKVGFSPDGHWLVTTSGRSVYFFDMTTSNPNATRLEFRDHRRAITTIAFSPDSHWMVTGTNKKAILPWQRDEAIRVWDLSSWPLSSTEIPGDNLRVETIAISPDSRWLATGTEDSLVQVWDLENISTPFVTYKDQRAPIRVVAFSPDGRWLASGSDDRSIWLRSNWQGSSASLIDLACQYAGRNLTRDEWDLYLVDQDYRKTCDAWGLENKTDFAWWQIWHWNIWPTLRWVLLSLASLALSILGLFLFWLLKAVYDGFMDRDA